MKKYLFLFVVLFGLSVALEAASLELSLDPVVVVGSNLTAFVGVHPTNIVGFSYSNGWKQIPVQVDERNVVSFRQVYGSAYPEFPTGVTFLAYTDTNTFTEGDANPLFDVDDELVFMAFDAGARAPENAELPAGVVVTSGVELALSDLLDGGRGSVYLFESASGLSPDAGANYVDYSFVLLSGNYKETYNFTGHGAGGSFPNPEMSVVTSACYQTEFSERWIREVEKITIGGADGMDYLDRHRVNLGSAFRTEETFTYGEGAFVANIDGPVRCIRSYLGSNSGPGTERTHIFYKQRQDIRTYLRTHSGISGPRDTYNYVTNATGMIYYNNYNTNGVAIDGSPENIALAVPCWEMVSGAHGTLLFSHSVDTDIPSFNHTNYYIDDITRNPTTGTNKCFGKHGPWVEMNSLPGTDPLLAYPNPAPNHLNSIRTIHYLGTNVTVSEAETIHAQVESPVAVLSSTFLGDSDSDGMADAWEQMHFSNLTQQADGDVDNPTPDGVDNLSEYIADTDPLNPEDYFRIEAITFDPLATVHFTSSSNREYSLYARTNLLSGEWFVVPWGTNKIGTGGADTISSTNDVDVEFFKMEVSLP